MGIGAGIFLIALGAILTFAVHWHISGLDLRVVGWILMLVGAAGVVLFFVFWNNRRRPAVPITASRSTEIYDNRPMPPPPST